MGKNTVTKQTFLVLGETQGTEDEPKRYKKPYWWERQIREGTFPREHQQRFAIDFNTKDKGNYDSPVPLETLAEQTQTSPPEDPDADYMTSIRGKRRPKNLQTPIKRAYNAHAKSQEHELNTDGAVENPKYSPPIHHPYPHFPADLDEKASLSYPHLNSANPTLTKLLYLKNEREWQFKSLAFRFKSSQKQVEIWYHRASFLNILYQRVHAQTSKHRQ